MIESERKWLLTSLPVFGPVPTYTDVKFDASHIMQGYLPDGSRVRQEVSLEEAIRKEGDPRSGPHIEYTHTIKTGTGQFREEEETYISEEEFCRLWHVTAGRRVNKIRFRVYDVLTWEIDVFLDRVLVLAEQEGIPPGYTPIIPDWLEQYILRDVTDEKGFTNKELAK